MKRKLKTRRSGDGNLVFAIVASILLFSLMLQARQPRLDRFASESVTLQGRIDRQGTLRTSLPYQTTMRASSETTTTPTRRGKP